jgi:CYTH domain-containing protein
VFEGHLTGLVLAEVEFDSTHEMHRQRRLPSWVARDVSDDVRFTGGTLAALGADEAAALLQQIASWR